MSKPRVAVVGAGSFGRNHLRVFDECEQAELVAAVDVDAETSAKAASEFACQGLRDWRELAGRVEAAVVAVPTTEHASVACGLMEAGIDVLVEKPIAPDLAAARRITETATARGRVLQVGHLESFNPAVTALQEAVTLPLFFEIHRMSVFSPRSLDVDVVLDLMIHDIDIVLTLTGAMPEEIRAAGIAILSPKADIANVRLAFSSGCVANLTASRVSTERVRKLRLFQPSQYISLDYSRQEAVAFSVSPERKIGFRPLTVNKDEPLRLEIAAFLDSVRSRNEPRVGGERAIRVLEVALKILNEIERHGATVRRSLSEFETRP